MSNAATSHTRRRVRQPRNTNIASTIATRSMMAAQMAVAIRAEAKTLLKIERRASNGVPIYYVQNLVTMISHTVEMAGQASSAAMAALEHHNLSVSSNLSGQDETLRAADALSKSASHQALSAKTLYEALVHSLAAREASRYKRTAAYDADSE